MIEAQPANKSKRFLYLLKSLISDDPSVRENQVILDSSEIPSLSSDLREWEAQQPPSLWAQLDIDAKVARANSDPCLPQESKDLYAKWMYHARKSYLVTKQIFSDKEAFEKLIKSIKRKSIKDLGDLGISKQVAERIFENHLMMEIAAELELDFSGSDKPGGYKDAMVESLKTDFYPYDGTYTPYIDVGWSSKGRIYGPPRLSLESVFHRPPFPLNGTPVTLYLISIDLPALGLGSSKQWKVGITKKHNIYGASKRSRFSGDLIKVISVVDSIRFSDGRDAFFLEQKIINVPSGSSDSRKASDFRVKVNPAFNSILRELIAKHGDYHKAKRELRDIAKGLGLGPSEWVWNGKSEEFVRHQFKALTSYAPYFGSVIDEYTQGELLL